MLTALVVGSVLLNLIIVRGPKDAVGYPEHPQPIAPWADRLKAAHYNAVENLVVFAALILVAHAGGYHARIDGDVRDGLFLGPRRARRGVRAGDSSGAHAGVRHRMGRAAVHRVAILAS